MTDVIDRLVVAMNAHDLDAVAGFIHEDYRSEQPAHPGRAFAGWRTSASGRCWTASWRISGCPRRTTGS